MCDCYMASCAVCGEPLPVHLADFDTGREEVALFCGEHIPFQDVSVFVVIKRWERDPSEPEVGWRMGIRSLTDNARKHAAGNVPNISSECERLDR